MFFTLVCGTSKLNAIAFLLQSFIFSQTFMLKFHIVHYMFIFKVCSCLCIFFMPKILWCLHSVVGTLELGEGMNGILDFLLRPLPHFSTYLFGFLWSNEWLLFRCLHFPYNDRRLWKQNWKMNEKRKLLLIKKNCLIEEY